MSSGGLGTGRAFVRASREYLSGEYVPKIRRCLDRLEPRRRSREFARREGDPDELFRRLRDTVDEACGVLEELDPDALGVVRTIQGQEVTVLQAVYHVVEHFSMHTGQIVYVTKLRTGRDLEFYRVEDGIAEENW